MSDLISADVIQPIKEQLENHPIYESVSTIEDLRCFMEHHIFSVWDFMSLVKYVQSTVAATQVPWMPDGDANLRRFINELVLEEECDETSTTGTYTSHFELYLTAMQEVGADTTAISRFLEIVRQKGINTALEESDIPAPSRAFTRATFDMIESNEPHAVAASLALGREHIIPAMFRAILQKANITEEDAPTFHYYLNRHVELDEGAHAPLSLRLLNELCGSDPEKTDVAIKAAQTAVAARVTLWDGVLEKLKKARLAA